MPSSPCARRKTACPRAHVKIVPIATETAAALFVAGTYARRQRAADRAYLGCRGSVRRTRRRGQPRRATAIFSIPIAWPARCALPAPLPRQVPAIDTVYVDFRNDAGLRRECEEACRDGFVGKMAIHPGAGADHQRGVHAVARAAIERARAIVAAFAARQVPAPSASTAGCSTGLISPSPSKCWRARRRETEYLV